MNHIDLSINRENTIDTYLNMYLPQVDLHVKTKSTKNEIPRHLISILKPFIFYPNGPLPKLLYILLPTIQVPG